MTLENHFNLYRFFLLFKKDLIQGYKALLITAAAVVGVILFLLLVSSPGEASSEVHQGLFLPLLWLGGLIFTSLSFKEAHSVNLIHNWLMTPASPLEKFLQKLLLTTVFYILALLAGFFLATCLNSLIYLIFFKRSVPLFNPAQSWLWVNIGHYLIVQSIFFLGAVWFRKYNFVKTVLTINVLQIGMTLTGGTIALLTYWGPIREATNGNAGFFMEGGQILIENFNRLNPLVITTMKIVYFGLLAPFFWFVSWLRMREIEVKDGV
ncbi:hypothetical protein [Oceanispirochaeta sp.]|jgi:hypothetical protein|uniref:hypothetical protein n=1 Tax=Oceanispirochaeta sp. TaxID=2035350 RepID=UPI002612E107|nr:hypothetical protein [Oceanispirochaeta sp.]MDA3958862.1 hypothetical protein [Oceanispirochaeta sp.]